MTERDLFLAALDISDPADRAQFVVEKCGPDAELRRKVEALLQAHVAAGSFLAAPAGDPDQTGLHESPEVKAPTENSRTILAGKYKFLQELGDGGMGTVWMADQMHPVKRRVAVKVVKAGMDSARILARFEAERQALALMDHPNIATVLDAGTTDSGQPFFVMELVKGVPLVQFCDENKLTMPDRLNLFVQICGAVQHAHQKGIIHRDLKPSNILIESHDGKPVPKVIDFGLAKATSGMQLSEHTLFTALGTVAGTPLYMAPEQATFNAVDVDTRADIYALGVILYELLTGTTPIERETFKKAAFDEMMRVIREQEPPTPSSRLSSSEAKASVAAVRQMEPAKLGRFVRGELDWIVMKALSKERDRRYETANGFGRDVERFLGHEPVVAGPPSTRYKLRKFVQRNRLQVTAVGMILLALVVGIAGTTWGMVWAIREADRADFEAGQAIASAATARSEATRADGESRAKDQETKRAKASERAARRLASEAGVTEGLRSAEGGKLDIARLWFAEALRRAPEDDDSVQSHRLRFALHHRFTPGYRTIACLVPQDFTYTVGYSPDGWLAAVINRNGLRRGHAVLVLDVASGTHLTPWLAHRDELLTATFSPDGRKLITTSSDQTARIWDIASGQMLTPPLVHPDGVSVAAFSPDGRRVVTADFKGGVRVWNVESGAPLTPPFQHSTMVSTVQFDPTGKKVMTIGFDVCRVWDAESGRLLWPSDTTRPSFVSASFSPDGQRVVSLSHDSSAQIWDVESGNSLGPIFRHEGWMRSAAFSPDGQRVITLSAKEHSGLTRIVQVRDAVSGQLVFPPLTLSDDIQSVYYAPDGRSILTVGGNMVRFWNANDGTSISPPLEHSRSILSASFLPDARRVVTKTDDLTIRVWTFDTGRSFTTEFDGRSAADFACFNSDGNRVLTVTNGAARTWNAESGKPVSGLVQHGNVVNLALFSPDGRRVLTAGWDLVVRLWDTETGASAAPPLRVRDRVLSAVFIPEGNGIALALEDGTTCIWDLSTKTSRGAVNRESGRVLSASISPDARRVVLTGGGFHHATVSDFGSGKILFPPLEHQNPLTSLSFSPDGRRILTSSFDKTARVWDANTGTPISPRLAHGDTIVTASFRADGRRVITASRDRSARIWDVETGRPITPPLPHPSAVTAASYSKDGQSVFTLCDRMGRLWDPDTGKPLSPPIEHEGGITSAAFSSDGNRMVFASPVSSTHLRNFEPDHRPIEDLVKLAELFSGARIDETGSIQPLTPDELRTHLTEMKAKYPAEFAGPSPARIKAWHTDQLAEADATKDAFAAAFHLRILLKSDPGNADLKAKLAAAEADLRNRQPREVAPPPRGAK
jgi:WD40 repeat protein/serine/threonine protein kinase